MYSIRLVLVLSVFCASFKIYMFLQGTTYPRDDATNISPRIIKCMDRNLHLQPSHPLCLIKQRIANYMYKVNIGLRDTEDTKKKRIITLQRYRGTFGQPAFSLHETLSPVVTTHQVRKTK